MLYAGQSHVSTSLKIACTIRSYAATSAGVAQVLPVYCYDPRSFAASRWGSTKTGPHRAAFLQQSVACLRASLQALGSGLLVGVGAPEALLPAALEGVAPGGGLVLCQEEVTSEETAVDAAVARAVKVGAATRRATWGQACIAWHEARRHADVKAVARTW
jgi:deoxyribodipyrimidine photolyase